MSQDPSSAALRILAANDDGATAPGLALLADVASALGEVVCIGPARKWTAASHHVSFDRDLTLTRLDARTYECSGTPVDGLIVGLATLCAESEPPDLVLAGINDKRNVGEDAAYSGTMAIAREAAMRAIPAIALSHERKDDYPQAERAWLAQLLRALYGTRAAWSADGGFLAVNLPARLPAGLAFPQLARDKIAAHCDLVTGDGDGITVRLRRGRPGTRAPGDENDVLAQGEVAIVRHRWHGATAPDASWVADLRRTLDA